MKTRKRFRIVPVFAIAMVFLFSSCSYLTGSGAASTPTTVPTASPTEGPKGIQTLPQTNGTATSPSASPTATSAANQSPAGATATPTPSASVKPTATPIPDDGKHLNVIGLYAPTSGKRELVDVYKANWVKGKDIDCFEAIASKEKTVSGSGYKSVWHSYWDKFDDSKDYKIGYCLTITLNSSEVLTKTITTPEDTLVNKEYVETYMYDDIHQQPGVRYSHIVREDVKEDTIATSIKLTAGQKIADVKEIKLTAFAYKGNEDFDADGNYTGSISYQITLPKS